MSSNIQNYSNNIDSAYPIEGVDNSSQGFRDNFSSIKLALTTASSEVSALQLTSVNVSQTNSFGFITGGITQASIQNSGLVSHNVTDPISGEIDYALGSYTKAAISTSTSLYIANWPPTGVYSQIRVEVKPTTATTMTVTFTAPGGSLVKEATVTLPYTSTSTIDSTVWDLWTIDHGTTVFLKFVGGPFS